MEQDLWVKDLEQEEVWEGEQAAEQVVEWAVARLVPADFVFALHVENKWRIE
jgi:hypothetical protein